MKISEEEMVDVVDEKDNIIKTMTRKEAYDKNLRHRVSRVIVINQKKDILLQKRASDKRKCLGEWDFGVAETLVAGEKYESAAIRWLMEELGIIGISNFDIKFLFKTIYDGEQTKRYYAAYSLIYNGKIKPGPKEVSEAKWVSVDFLKDMMKKEKFVPAGLEVWKRYMRGVKE